MYITNIFTCLIYSNGTPNKGIPMVTNPLNANDEDKKPDKLEAETTRQTAEAGTGCLM